MNTSVRSYLSYLPGARPAAPSLHVERVCRVCALCRSTRVLAVTVSRARRRRCLRASHRVAATLSSPLAPLHAGARRGHVPAQDYTQT
eukprot:6206509-Pleurochrysis_carterae.AAC.1